MPAPRPHLTGVERTFGKDEIIVTKTDLKGRLTYANEVFLRVAQYTEAEVLGKPHNIIRHPDMPRCVFKLLWDTIMDGREIFAYVINRAKSGDHYWVFAHVTPSYDGQGRMCGFHSNRRFPRRDAVAKVQSVYRTLLTAERRFVNPKEQMAASMPIFVEFLARQKTTYEELVFAL